MNKKQIGKTVVFFILLLVILGWLTSVFIPKWITGTSVSRLSDEFFHLPKDTVEVGVIGSSQLVNGISCARFVEKYGISAYSCAVGEQPVLCSWFYLLELYRTQHIKTVIYDTSMLYEPEQEVRFCKTLDTAPMSLNKMKLILERGKSEESSSFFSYLFPLLRYHSRWDELKRRDFGYDKTNTNMFYGNIMISGVNREAVLSKICVDDEIPKDGVTMDPAELSAFQKIVAFCEEKGIKLILIKTPKTTWESAKTIGCRELAKEYGLTYIDFNEAKNLEAMGFDITNDMANWDHLNVRGADKLTDYLAQYLLAEDNYIDCRTMDYYDVQKGKKYKADHENKMLQSCILPMEYALLLQNDRFQVFWQQTEDITPGLSAKEQKAFSMVPTTPFEKEEDMDAGTVMLANQKIVFSKTGWNMVVCDKENNQIVDIVTLYRNEESQIDMIHGLKEEQED